MNSDRTQVETHNRRTWPASTIDLFIVGRIHGGYNINQILLYISYHHDVSLTAITVDELESLWTNVVQNPTNTHFTYWENIPREDPRVQEVLDHISTLLLEATH